MNTSINKGYSTVRWIMLSQLLLALYLAFFHTALGKSPPETILIGLGFSAISTGVVVLCRNAFFNRFEFLIHLVIGLDIFCEGFVPYHESFGFYYCALGFWSVFWIYHGFLLYWQRAKAVMSPTAAAQPGG